jgi:hypothetical protein
MTDRTPNRLYPFPECDPPLVKDASDINDLFELASAIDTDAAAMSAKIDDFIDKPDSARMSLAGSLVVPSVTTDFIFTVAYNTVTYDNAGMASTANNGMIIVERGFYLVTSVLRLTSASNTAGDLAVAHLTGGALFGRRYEGPSGEILAGATGDSSMTTTDVLLLQAGDLLQTSGLFNAPLAGTYTIEARLAAHQLFKLDV